MKIFDRGRYIRKQNDYINMLERQQYMVCNIKKISKLAYKEILFAALKTV